MTRTTDARRPQGFLCSVSPEKHGQKNKAKAERRCREVLAKQLGLITRPQALACGLSTSQIDTRLGRGEWIALYPGVYAIGTSASTWRRSVLAAILCGGPEAVASGRCAAAILGFPGFRPGRVEITTPKQLKKAPFTVHRGVVPGEQTVRIGPLRLTDATRTLLDIAAISPEDVVEAGLDDALRRSLTSLPRLRWLLRTAGGKGKKGSGTLARLVEERADGQPIPESVLETRLWKPLTRLGVPHPIRQHEVQSIGERYRIDFAFPHAMVAVEAQSYRWHSSPQALQKDADKHNALVGLGWNVVYLTWKDVSEKRKETMAFLRDLLLPRFL